MSGRGAGSELPVGRKAAEAAPVADEALLRACGAGDAAAFRALFDRYEALLMRFFQRMLGSQEDAEEAVVDTFLRVWRGAGAYRGEASARTWLYRIAHRIALDALRRRTRRPRADVPLPGDAERDLGLFGAGEDGDPVALLVREFQREEDRRLLRQALACLSPTDRVLLTLFYFEESSYVQIGAIRGESLPRVKGLLHRARQRLKAHFVRLRGEDDPAELLADAPADPVLDSGRLFAL